MINMERCLKFSCWKTVMFNEDLVRKGNQWLFALFAKIDEGTLVKESRQQGFFDLIER